MYSTKILENRKRFQNRSCYGLSNNWACCSSIRPCLPEVRVHPLEHQPWSWLRVDIDLRAGFFFDDIHDLSYVWASLYGWYLMSTQLTLE